MNGSDGEVTLRLPAQPRYIRMARLVAAGMADDLGRDLEALDDIRLAVGEVCALAVQLEAEAIELRYLATAESLVVTGRAVRAAAAPGAVIDEEHLVLVKQILGVACSAHELTRTGDVVSFTLTFAHAA